MSQNANARLGASTEARIVASLPAGTLIQVVGERLGTVIGSTGAWCETIINGQSAFIHAGALELAEESAPAAPDGSQPDTEGSAPAPATGQTYRVIGNQGVNGRAAPNTGARVVVVIPAGSEVLVTGQQTGTRVNGTDLWFAVNFVGQNVFVHSSLLTPVQPNSTTDQPAQPSGPLTSPKGNGTYVVNVNIAPGRWESTGTGQSCYWERLDANGEIIANHFGSAGGTVTIHPSDNRVMFRGCGTYYYVEEQPLPPAHDLTASRGDGIYRVGVEIATGHWTTLGPSRTCYWERLDQFQEIIDNHFGEAGGFIYVSPTDYELHVSNCGTLVYADGQPRELRPDAYAPKGDGFYTVGVEIAPGNWFSTGQGNRCYWARLDAFQGIIENHYGETGGKIFVMPTDFELYVSGCGDIIYGG